MRRKVGSIVWMGSWLALGVWLASASAVRAENCQPLFHDGRTFRCDFLFEFGGSSETCVEALQPGIFSADFDLGGNFFLVGCECRPTGSVANPSFDASENTLHCTGDSEGGPMYLAGKTGRDAHGHTFFHGQGIFSGRTGQFTYRCVQDPSCNQK